MPESVSKWGVTMKKLHYTIWLLIYRLGKLLEPNNCQALDPTCPDKCCYCERHEGHGGNHWFSGDLA